MAADMLSDRFFPDNASLEKDGVKISSYISNVSYKNLLWQSATNPFAVLMTSIQCIEGKFPETVIVDSRDANGNQALTVISLPVKKEGNNVITDKTPYKIDSLTAYIINELPAKSHLFFFFFPAQMPVKKTNNVEEYENGVVRANYIHTTATPVEQVKSEENP